MLLLLFLLLMGCNKEKSIIPDGYAFLEGEWILTPYDAKQQVYQINIDKKRCTLRNKIDRDITYSITSLNIDTLGSNILTVRLIIKKDKQEIIFYFDMDNKNKADIQFLFGQFYNMMDIASYNSHFEPYYSYLKQ